MPKGIAGIHKATYVCEQCGRSFERYASQAKRHAFCSKDCYAASMIGTPGRGPGFTAEAREKARRAVMGRPNPKNAALARLRTGTKSPRWRGNQATEQTGRHRAGKMYPIRPCEVCGATPDKARIHRHHKDQDTKNNKPSNIAFLCAKHHKEAHRGGDHANQGSD